MSNEEKVVFLSGKKISLRPISKNDVGKLLS